MIVEDNEKNMADAIDILGGDVEILFAKNYEEAFTILHRQKPEGVITEVFISRDKTNKEKQPFGVNIAAVAMGKGIKTVFCCDENKGKAEVMWAYDLFLRLRDPLKLMWGYDFFTGKDDDGRKKWLDALWCLTTNVEMG